MNDWSRLAVDPDDAKTRAEKELADTNTLAEGDTGSAYQEASATRGSPGRSGEDNSVCP